MNKMHFYHFLPSFVNGFHRFHGFFCVFRVFCGSFFNIGFDGFNGCSYLCNLLTFIFNNEFHKLH